MPVTVAANQSSFKQANKPRAVMSQVRQAFVTMQALAFVVDIKAADFFFGVVPVNIRPVVQLSLEEDQLCSQP